MEQQKRQCARHELIETTIIIIIIYLCLSGSANASIGNTGIHAPAGKCYSCTTEDKLTADNVTFILQDVKIQPFALKSNNTYGAGKLFIVQAW